MAKTSIGSAALILSANGAKLGKGLDQAYTQVQGFKNRITAGFASLGASSPIIAAVLGGAKLVGDAIGRIGELSAIGKQAKALGVSSEMYQGLALAAKRANVETAEFGGMLGKLGSKIAAGGTETAAALGRIGLSIGQLQGLSPDQQFLAIADGLKGVSDNGTRSFVAMKLFEESGLKLLPVLSQGSEKLRAFIEQQKKLGTVLGDGQMNGVMKAQAAFPKIQAAFEGVWNRVVVAMAPLLETVGSALSKVLEKLQPVFDWIGRAAEAYYGIIGPAIGVVIDTISEAIGMMFEWGASLFDFGGQWPTVGEVITFALKAIATAGAYAFDILTAGAGVVVIGLSLLVDAFGLVLRGLKNLLELGAKLPDSLGGQEFKAAATTMKGWQDRTENAAASMRKWGGEAITGFGNSAEKVGKWFDALKTKKEDVLDMQPAAEQITNATNTITKKKGSADAGAIYFGSKEDYSLRVQFANGQKREADAMLAELKKQNELKKAGNASLEKIANQNPAKIKTL